MKIHIKRIEDITLLDKCIAWLNKSQVDYYVVMYIDNSRFQPFNHLGWEERTERIIKGIHKDGTNEIRKEVFVGCYLIIAGDKDESIFRIKFDDLSIYLDDKSSDNTIMHTGYNIPDVYDKVTRYMLSKFNSNRYTESELNTRSIIKYINSLCYSTSSFIYDKNTRHFFIEETLCNAFERDMASYADPTQIFYHPKIDPSERRMRTYVNS